MSSTTAGATLPSGIKVLASFPDALAIVEFVFGGLVWILVASTRVHDNMSQGWVMFVSVFCFVISTLLLFLYMCGAHGGKSAWVAVDAFYQVIATIFYLSASVLQAYTTYYMKTGVFKNYQIDIAAVVFAYAVTLTYFIHMVFSLVRWKAS
ncbi:myelin and lymphocyte protein [Anolis carolinensis]|uniref:myelin and lymphocyte protein n=1 Tax=Anolis carolinensis TaxID=28377 RepID=UPI000462B26E|nr:PREDICTED: myelin and lymphocyte protein [Anolis carolinensis]|eukprot:XP_003216153.2 PREDICTED: myelin and lymphocyte protein [Anolis carolinensis]